MTHNCKLEPDALSASSWLNDAHCRPASLLGFLWNRLVADGGRGVGGSFVLTSWLCRVCSEELGIIVRRRTSNSLVKKQSTQYLTGVNLMAIGCSWLLTLSKRLHVSHSPVLSNWNPARLVVDEVSTVLEAWMTVLLPSVTFSCSSDWWWPVDKRRWGWTLTFSLKSSSDCYSAKYIFILPPTNFRVPVLCVYPFQYIYRQTGQTFRHYVDLKITILIERPLNE